MYISIIIPAYNEEHRITPTLEEIYHFAKSSFSSFEIIVVDDGSSDKTVEKIRMLDYPELSILSFPENKGKGAAVKAGALNAKGDCVLFADADGSTPFSEVTKLLKAFESGAEIAIGSRALLSPDSQVTTSLHRKICGRIFNYAVNFLLVPGIADTQCGFKLFSKKAASFLFSRQTSERFSFDVEILSIAQKAKIRIVEIPINWHNVPGSKVNMLKDATNMLLDTLRFKFIHRNITQRDYSEFREPSLPA